MISPARFGGIFPTRHFAEGVAVYSSLVGYLQENAFRPGYPGARGLSSMETCLNGSGHDEPQVLEPTLDHEELNWGVCSGE